MAEGSADERLVVMLEARISEFEKRMAAAERRGTRTYTGLQRGSARATAQMEADALRAAGRINQALATVHSQIGGFAKAFAGGVAVSALSGLAGAARAAVGEMADLADVADRVGIDVESFQGLQQGLKLAGVDASEATDALQAFTDRLGDAAKGQGTLAQVMAQSGVALTDSNGKMRNTLDILRDYADVVKNSPDAAQKMALVTEAFGRGGKAMVLAMSEGRAGIDGMISDARAAGGVIDESMIRKAAELDDKFDLVGQRIGAIFKSGIVSAAEFFGMFDRLDDLIPQGAAENLLGADLANALAENSTALEKSKEDLAELAYLYDQLQAQVTAAADTISNEIPYLVEIGADDLALELSDVTGEMGLLVAQVKDGKIPADQLGAEMQKLIDRAALALSTANKIDGVNLDGAVSAVGRVSTALQDAVGWAASLLSNMGLIAGLDVSGGDGVGAGGMDADARGRVITPSKLAPGSTSRPRRAPPLLGEPGAVGSGSGKGGGGSGKIEALLADLQTEREILNSWYAESLQLLNGATEAQLAAVGGRHGALERLEAEHLERLRALRDDAATGTLANAETLFGALATLTANGTGKIAKVHRVAAASEAFVNVLRAQAQVLADPKLNFIAKLPAMAAIGNAGAGIIKALGGGGSVKTSSATGGAGADSSGSNPGGQSAQPLRFLVEGLDATKFYTGQMLIDLTTAIQKELGNRGLILEFGQ